MPINLPPGVSLHPNSSTRNRVQATGDFVSFSVQQASGQTNPFVQVFNTGGISLGFWDVNGYLTTRLPTNVSGANELGDQIVVRPAYIPSANVQFWKDASETKAASVGLHVPGVSVGDDYTVATWNGGGWQEAFHVASHGDMVRPTGAAGNRGLVLQGAASQTAALLGLQGISSTSTVRDQVDITCTWATSTDATRKARAVFNIYDTAAREALRLEASGSAAMIGFLGASAVVRPASTTDLRQAVIDLGLYTTGGATPLNLNGGTLTAATIVGDCTGAVSLTPGSDTRNRIQGTADFIPLSVEQFAGQTHDLFAAYASDGTTKLFRVEAAGTPSCPGTGALSERFGDGASAGDRSVAFGQAASAATSAVAMGQSANASGAEAVAVGELSVASGQSTVALGHQATASGAQFCVAIGQGATAAITDSIALGTNAATSGGSGGIAIGRNAACPGGGIAIGYFSSVGALNPLALGTGAAAAGDGSIALGWATQAPQAQQFVAGSDSARIADVYFDRGVTYTAPAGFTLHGTGGSGSNVAGGSITLAGGKGTGSAVGGDLIFQSSLADGSGSTLNALRELMRLSSVGLLSLTQLTSVQDRTAFDLTPSWATSTDASRKARAVLNIWDTAAREALRLEASGSAAMIGFLGAPAVVQQPSTADLKDSFCGFGFQVNGGATPLDLDGGTMRAGNYATAIATKIANYTLTATDGTILGDAATGGFSVTMPTAVGIAGRVYVVKKIDTGPNLLTVLPNGAETIDGSASAAIRIPETALALQSDGAGWRII